MSELKRYIVCHPDDDGTECGLYETASPEQAVLEWIAEFCEDCDLDVYEAFPQRPVLDIAELMDEWGECNPEESPLEKTWSMYAGADAVAAVQETLDAVIQDYIPAWYFAGKLLYEHRVKLKEKTMEVVDDMEDCLCNGLDCRDSRWAEDIIRNWEKLDEELPR